MPINMNRLSNVRNPYQGTSKRVLCVCSGGLLRSPTIAWVLSNDPYNFNTRSCGTSDEYALNVIDDVLVNWADEIVCADIDHYRYVDKHYYSAIKVIINLRIPDIYGYRDPELVELIKERYACG